MPPTISNHPSDIFELFACKNYNQNAAKLLTVWSVLGRPFRVIAYSSPPVYGVLRHFGYSTSRKVIGQRLHSRRSPRLVHATATMAPRGSSAVNGRVAYQQLETLVRQDAVMKRARRDKARAEAKGPIEYLWPLLGALCLVLLVAVSIHGFTDHTEMGHGVGSGRRGGPDDPLPYDSLDPGDIGAVWTTARVLRHFGRSTAADVRVAWDVTDLQTLDTALAPVTREGAALGVVTNDIVHVPVSWSKALPGNGGAGAPVVARTTHHASRATTDGEPLVPLDDLLDRFWRGVREQDAIGRERGLMLSFRDPRAVVPGLRAVRELIRRGRLHGPLIVDAEILPGPGGFLPQMAAVFDPDPPLRALKDDEGVPEGVHEVFEPNLPFPPVPGDAEGSANRAARSRKIVKFHPTAFVAKTKLIVPGAILSVGFSTHGGCVDGADPVAARAAYASWYEGGAFAYDSGGGVAGGNRRRTSGVGPGRSLRSDDESESKKAEAEVMEELEEEVEADAVAEAEEAIADAEAEKAAADANPEDAKASEELKKKLEAESSTPLDELADEPETYDDLDPRYVKALAEIDLSEEYFPFDLDDLALRNEKYFKAPGWAYDEAMMQDAYWLFRNATWRGDVWFNVEACMLRPDGKNVGSFVQDNENPPYKRMLSQKLGYAIVYHSRTKQGGAFDEVDGWRKFLTAGGVGADERARPDRTNTFVGDVRIYEADGVDFKRPDVVFPPTEIPTQSEL